MYSSTPINISYICRTSKDYIYIMLFFYFSLGRENGEVATLVEALLHERASAEIYDDFSGTALEGIVNKIVIDKSDKKIVPVRSPTLKYTIIV